MKKLQKIPQNLDFNPIYFLMIMIFMMASCKLLHEKPPEEATENAQGEISAYLANVVDNGNSEMRVEVPVQTIDQKKSMEFMNMIEKITSENRPTMVRFDPTARYASMLWIIFYYKKSDFTCHGSSLFVKKGNYLLVYPAQELLDLVWKWSLSKSIQSKVSRLPIERQLAAPWTDREFKDAFR
jgi:hypothetical protein